MSIDRHARDTEWLIRYEDGKLIKDCETQSSSIITIAVLMDIRRELRLIRAATERKKVKRKARK